MKIVLIVHNLTGGGAERVAALWASGFAGNEHEVHVIVSDYTEQHTYNITNNVAIHKISPITRNALLAKIIRPTGITRYYFTKRLAEQINSINPDVCIGVMGTYIPDLINSNLMCKPLFIQTYHSSFDLPSTAPLKRINDVKKVYERDRGIKVHTVLTQADKTFIGDRISGVYTLPNPLTFTPVSSIPIKQKVILACGRLDVWEVKGFDLLLEAWGMIAKKYGSWKLQIAGTGETKSKDFLNDLCKKNKISNQVEFLGFRDDILDLYRNAEIFVLSSRYEGFGMVLIEAMSQGCACVAADYKGRQSEIIENDTQGITCEVESSKAIADAMEKMIVDDEYRRKCQTNAVERSKFYSLENTIERWNNIFREQGIIK